MKLISLAILMLACISAHASYYQDTCWNSDSNVEWGTGHAGDSVKIMYFSEEDYENYLAEFSLDELNITVTHRKQLMGDCGSVEDDNWSSCWYTVRMLITPKPEAEARFKQIKWLNGKFDGKMVCQKVRS